MKTTLTTLLTLIIILSVSCRNSKPTAESTAEVEKPEVVDSIPKVEVVRGYKLPETSDPYKLKGARVVGNILEIDVQYSGGCNDHQFFVKSDGNYMKSNPPQLRLFIEHENNGDMCKALISETRKFDLTEVKMPGKDKGYTVILRLPNTENTVEYKY